jgi:acyl carrier protein phosphodiesterase
MNFLAHVYLSGDNPKIMLGNFIGDFVKGKQALNSFEKEIILGIALHRHIDAFTDTHEIVHESKKRLRLKYRHYANVIVDVFYDHFLAKQWNEYHTRPLQEYSASVYKTIQSFNDILPGGAKYMLPHMIAGNWLLNYGKIEGIGRALSGMSQRTTYESKMEQAVNDLREHYDLFKDEFDRFFPVLIDSCKTWLNDHQPLA